MDQDRLRRRVHGREQAKEIIAIVDFSNPDAIAAFIDEITCTLCPKETEAKRMDKQRQFSEFSNYVLTFGEHKGMRLENIPRWYLEWLADSSTETLEMVQGYLEATEE